MQPTKRANGAPDLGRHDAMRHPTARIAGPADQSAAMRHDFGNLLLAMSSQVDLMQRSLPANHSVQRCVSAMRKAIQHGQHLAAASPRRRDAITPHHLGRTNLCAVVQDAFEMIAQSAGESARVLLDVACRPSIINGHTVRLQRLILNLAHNALAAMPDGGLLVVQLVGRNTGTQTVPAGGPEGRLPPVRRASGGSSIPTCDEREARRVDLIVEDTGPGLPWPILEALALPPAQRDAALCRRAGLGLRIVCAIAAEHGATLHVASARNKGTCFRLSFPGA